jgi:hypothetical protein
MDMNMQGHMVYEIAPLTTTIKPKKAGSRLQISMSQSLWCLYRFINHQFSSLLSSVNIFVVIRVNLNNNLFLIFKCISQRKSLIGILVNTGKLTTHLKKQNEKCPYVSREVNNVANHKGRSPSNYRLYDFW